MQPNATDASASRNATPEILRASVLSKTLSKTLSFLLLLLLLLPMRPVTGTLDFTQVFRVLADNQSMPMDWQRVEDHQGHATQDAEQDALRKERRTFASNPSPSLFADPWFPSNSFNRSFNVVPVSLPGSSEVKRGKTNQSEVLFFLSLSPWLSALSITPVLPPRTPQHRATQFLVMPRSF